MNTRFLVIFILLLIAHNLSPQIRINEFMQSNIDCLMDELNDFPDSWIELYNENDEGVNIENWYISENKDYSKGWKLSGLTYIPPKGYLIIYCDKVGSGIHTDFRMETTKKSDLYLFDNNGNLIDLVIDIPAQPNPNISMGIDANNLLSYFIESTPGKENISKTANRITPAPTFSEPAGIYKSTVNLEITDINAIPNSKIYFTTDGSEPNTNSQIYNQPIKIEQTTVIKAKIIADNYLIPQAITNTYIITERDFSLPIISISTDDSYLSDDMIGIYTIGKNGINGCGDDIVPLANYRTNWRRPMVLEYFPEQDMTSVINQLGEMRVMGQCSRENPVKSLAVYSNKRFGKKHFSYPIFQNEDKKNITIKSMLLRNAGNDWFESYNNDALIQSLMGGKVNLEYQAYQPSVFFLNGKYMGIINIRERSNTDHVYGNYNELEDIDFFENWIHLRAGDYADLDFLMSGLENKTFSYENLHQLVDIDEFINLYILQIFVANWDFPGNNSTMWKKKDETSKWKFIVKDTDWGLLTDPSLQSYNTLHYNLNPVEGAVNSERATLLFRTLMTHNEFQNKFLNYFTVYMGDLLSENRVHSVIDSINGIIKNEIPYHLDLHQLHSFETWSYLSGNKKKNWVSQRYLHQYQHLNDHYGYNGLINLSIKEVENATTSPIIYMNDVGLQTNKFDGMYYKGQNFELEWKGNPEEFGGWEVTKHYENENALPIANIYSETKTVISVEDHIKAIEIKTLIPESKPDPDPQLKSDVRVYKIFTGDAINVIGMQGEHTIEVYDLSGRLVKQITTRSYIRTVYLPRRGVYNFKVSDKLGNVTNLRAIY